MTIQLILYTLLMVCTSHNLMILIIFCFGMNSSIRINVGFVYLMELMPKKKQTLAGTAWNIGEAFTYFIGTVYFWKINKNWEYISLVGYCMTIVAFLGCSYLPESPKLLLELGRPEEALQSLKEIAEWNKSKHKPEMHDLLEQQAD